MPLLSRILLATFFMLAVHGLARAQGIPMTLGNKIEIEKYPQGAVYFNTTLKQGYLIARKARKVTPINDYLQYTEASAIPMKPDMLADTRTTYLESFYNLGSKNYFIYSVADKDRDEIVVYSHEVNAEMVLQGSPVIMAKFKGSKTNTGVLVIGSGFVQDSQINVRRSRDGKHIVVYRTKEDHAIEMAAFSPEKGPLWSKKFELDPEFKYWIRTVQVADAGNVYIAGGYYKGTETLKSSFLLAYSPEKDLRKLYTVPVVKKREDSGYTVRLLADGTPLWAGLYYDASAEQSGYRLNRIDPVTLELTNLTEKPFTKDYRDALFRGGYELKHYRVTNILDMGNGDIVFDVEGQTVQSAKYVTTGYCTPVYVVRADKQGNEKWTTVIQKYQVQPEGSWLIGHEMYFRGDKIYLVYNDNPENIGSSPTEKQRETLLKKKVYVALVEIDNTGKSTRTGLFSQDKKQFSSTASADVMRIDDHQYQYLFKFADGYQYTVLRVNE